MDERESICLRCFHSYVCEQFNEHRDVKNDKCHFYNDHFVPYADVAPVVRCRECKYRFKNNGHDKIGCPIIDTNIWMDDDDFCSHGEREEGADNEP